MDRFQDKTAVEAPGESATVARQMFGADHTVRGQEAVLNVGEHGVHPAEGGVTGGGTIGAGNMAVMDDEWAPDCYRDLGQLSLGGWTRWPPT